MKQKCHSECRLEIYTGFIETPSIIDDEWFHEKKTNRKKFSLKNDWFVDADFKNFLELEHSRASTF